MKIFLIDAASHLLNSENNQYIKLYSNKILITVVTAPTGIEILSD